MIAGGVAWCVRHATAVWAACACVLVGGAVAAPRLTFAAKSEVELPRLQALAVWPGASPESMEMYVTAPMEAAVHGVRGVHRVSSTSQSGSASLAIELEPGANVQLVRLGVLERLESLHAGSAFPPGVAQPMVANYVPERLQESPLMEVTIAGPYTPSALQKILADVVTPRLAAVAGVSPVSAPQGGAEVAVAVRYDARRLRELGISPDALSAAVGDARIVRPLGEERLGASARTIVLRDEATSIGALSALPVRAPDGRVFSLGQLATIQREEDAQGEFLRINHYPALAVRVMRAPNADAIHTAALLSREIAALASQLPPGVTAAIATNAADAIKQNVHGVAVRGALAFVLVMGALALFLGARSALIVLGSATVAVAGTALSLFVLRIPANMLTLAGVGMGLGILVQDSLIALGGAAQMAPAVIGSTLTSAVVLLPFLYLQGNARAAFTPFALAFLLALGWSVVAALGVVPTLAKTCGVRRCGVRRKKWRWGRRVYARALWWTLQFQRTTLAAAAVGLAALAWVFAAKVPRAEWGTDDAQRTSLAVYLSFPRGSDPKALDTAVGAFESLVAPRSEIEQVLAQGGESNAQLLVTFTDRGALTAAPLELQEQFTARAALIGGANVRVQGQGPGFSAGAAPGMAAQLRIKVLGYSYRGVERVAVDLKNRLEQLSRVRNVNIDAASLTLGAERAHEVRLAPQRNALATFGVTPAQFASAVARALRSGGARQYAEISGEEIAVRVRPAGTQTSLDDLRESPVPNALGAPLKIADVATAEERDALSVIQREDQQYVRMVSYEFRGGAEIARRTHEAFLNTVTVAPGFTVTDDSNARAGADASGDRLWLVFAVGVSLVVLAVALVFDSVWVAFIVLLSLPLSLAGVAVAFWAFSAPFTREAAVGVILVIGLAAHQAILLVFGKSGVAKSLDASAVLRVAVDRSGIISLVTLTALASLLPLSIGVAPTSRFGAIALASLGGMVAGTLGTLFVIPALLTRLSPMRAKAYLFRPPSIQRLPSGLPTSQE